ncbi:MAG TPA: MASE1 domain-containing protein [Caulobacterales bacterium]|nr:MASE1 domain-containing protein [Caulobacterales bacterium]
MAADFSVGRSTMVRAVAIGVCYGVLSYFSLAYTRFGAQVESIWISNALLAWALRVAPVRQWPVYIAWASLGHVAAHLSVGDRLDFSLAFLLGDMVESALCAWMLTHRPRGADVLTRGGVFYFVFVSGVVAPMASAAIASGATALLSRDMGARDFFTWYAADALGLLVFQPIFIGMGAGRWRELKGKLGKLAFAVAAVSAAALMAANLPQIPPVRLLTMPVFVLIALDLGVAGVEVCLVVLLLTTVLATLHAHVPKLWPGLDQRETFLAQQSYLALLAVTMLPLAVILEEKQRLMKMLSESMHETREAWGAIVGAEARYRLVVDNVSETVMRVAPSGLILFASRACARMLHGQHELEGRCLFDFFAPGEGAAERERFAQSVEQGMLNMAQRGLWRFRGDDGAWVAIDASFTLVAPGGVGHEEFVVVLRPIDAA